MTAWTDADDALGAPCERPGCQACADIGQTVRRPDASRAERVARLTAHSRPPARRAQAVRPLLICEPSRPPDLPRRGPGVKGWRWGRITDSDGRRSWGWVRDHADDAWGAVVQEIVVQYLVRGTSRGDLARQYPISERPIQAYANGSSWANYSGPVLAILERLGLTMTHKSRQRRYERIAASMLRRSADLCRLLADDERPEARRIADELAVLAYAHQLGAEVTP